MKFKFWEKKMKEIAPSIQSAIAEIEEKNNNVLTSMELADHFDNLVKTGRERIQREKENFIQDFITNPENKLRMKFESSASKGYTGTYYEKGEYTLGQKAGLEELGFTFHTDDQGKTYIDWPTIKQSKEKEE